MINNKLEFQVKVYKCFFSQIRNTRFIFNVFECLSIFTYSIWKF